MKRILLLSLFSFPFLASSQITLNQMDNFENFTTANWTRLSAAIPNENILTGGPQGTDDNFLRVRANGGANASGKLLTLNNAQWKGNYITAGVSYISMDVRNSGSNVIFLRLSFQNIAWTNDPKWSSINPIAVVPGQGWNTIVFPIDANSMTRLGHTNTYTGDFNNINEVRIVHDDAPGWDGDPIDAILDIDNIQAKNNNLELVDWTQLNNGLTVFPNPASNYIKVNGLVGDSKMFIFDVSGRKVKTVVIKNLDTVDIQDLTNGVYFLKLENGITFKFVKS